jgi:hypothetical protein
VLDRAPLGLGADEVGITGAMAFAEGVSPGDEGDGLFVVHRHPAEGLADVPGRGEWVGVGVGALRIDIDQPHLHGTERSGQFAVAGVALVAEPGVLGTPEHLFRFPDVGTAEGEAERLEAHRLHGAVASEHEEVGPRELPAVLPFHRPQQPAGLVEVGVVGPTVERGEALGAIAGAAATVLDAVGAGGVPAHPDEERPVMAVVGGPPLL